MIKKLLKSVRQYKTKTLLTPLVMIGEAALEILIPFVMTLLIGVIESADVIGRAEIGKIAMYGGIMLAMALVSLTCGALGGKFASEASAGFAANLREDMYGKIQTYSFANIDKFSASSLITRLTMDVSNVQMAFQMSIRMLVRAPILFLFASIMSFVIEPTIAWIFIVAAAILGGVVFFIMGKVQPNFRMMFKKYDKLNAVAQENLTGIRVVKAYVLEGQEIDKYQKAAKDVYDYSVRAEKIMVTMNPIVQTIMYATMILLLAVGGVRVVGGSLEIADLTGLLSYSTQILSGIMTVAMALTFIAMSRPAMERITEVLSEESTILPSEHPVYEVKDGSITFENVSFSYAEGKTDVLRGINLSIRSGETIGIVGGTGSAKSTLVSLIPRLYDARVGKVTVGGLDVKEYDLDTLRNAVAMVLQKNVLFSGSIAENLRWGKEDATQEEIEFAAKQACADEFIEQLPGKYEYDLGQGGVNVSGGQKQRLCIARALLKKPKVLILDDSTSAVDTKTDASIRAALKQHAPEVTKLIIAQRIASVQDSDRILVMDGGEVSAFGTHEELMQSSEIYRGVYESQNRGGQEDGADE
ncbi:MAG: ABC transporter ATP-binding protein [Clostridia bacterium]|nr:ABC transporter ATP-binding protein [Clostridia bacterium]